MKVDYPSSEHIHRQLSRPPKVTEVAIGAWSIVEVDGDLVIVNNKTKQQIVLARGDVDG